MSFFSGTSSLSPDHRNLLVFNLQNGLDLYNLGDNIPIQSYRSPARQETYDVPLGVAFLHNGTAVVCGSQSGNVVVWNTATGIQLQSLEHQGVPVQAISARQLPDCMFIATATMTTGTDNHIQVWHSATVDAGSRAGTGWKDLVHRHRTLLITFLSGIILLFLHICLGSIFIPYVVLRDGVTGATLFVFEFVVNCSKKFAFLLRRLIGQIGVFSKQILRRAILELLREEDV